MEHLTSRRVTLPSSENEPNAILPSIQGFQMEPSKTIHPIHKKDKSIIKRRRIRKRIANVKCSFCEKLIASRDLVNHLLENHKNEGNKIKCPLCSTREGFHPERSVSQLVRHLKYKHNLKAPITEKYFQIYENEHWNTFNQSKEAQWDYIASVDCKFSKESDDCIQCSSRNRDRSQYIIFPNCTHFIHKKCTYYNIEYCPECE